MDEDRSETTEQVVKFPLKQQSSIPADEAGQAVIAKIRKAAELSHETCDRAMALAHKLAMQLREAEDRINRLEGEVALSETEGPAPKDGFKRSTKRSRKSSSLRDQPPAPNKTWYHLRIQTTRKLLGLPLRKSTSSALLFLACSAVEPCWN
jgi:hypothetical protein